MIAPAAGFSLPAARTLSPVPVEDCRCGVCYDADCPVFAHRVLCENERANLRPGERAMLRRLLYFWADRLGRRVNGWRMVPAEAA